MSDFWAWLRCWLLKIGCPWRPVPSDPVVRELRARAAEADRQTETLRRARLEGRFPSWEELYGRDKPGGAR